MPFTPVHNGVERRQFAMEVESHLFRPGDQMGRSQNHQRINYDRWAIEWNEHCDKIQLGQVEWEAVYRKASKHLQSYHEKYKAHANAAVTMMSIRQHHAELRTDLQEPAGGGRFAGFVGTVVPTPVPRGRTGAGISGSGGSAGGGAAGSAGVSTGVEEMLDFGAGGEMEVDATQPKPKKPKGPPQAAQHCLHCGHRRQKGAYKEAHPPPNQRGGRSPCSVPSAEYRSEDCRTGKVRPDGKRSWSRCDCEKCTAGSIIVA